MSEHRCPACRRAFAEPGFCPHDGTPLIVAAAPDARTVLSTAHVAQEPPTDVELRRGTLPLTPTPAASAETQEITAARTRLAPDAPRIRARSASEDPQAALAMLRDAREQPSEYDRLVGQTLDGRYFVERKLGEGGMGVVFAARHAVIERPLAIKVLKREVMRDTATIKRFVQEAQAASRIGHPNIVDVTDFGTTPDGMTFSVMEYVDGQTLGAAIRHGAPFAKERAIRIAVQIARALGAAHDKGIVHRDLKPENVFLLDRDNRPDFVKIVDFGIAKVAPLPGANPDEPRLTRAGSVFGTPEYMAPEQAAGRSDTDGRVDVYALGILLYEMLTARVPHRGDSTLRTLAMQMLDPIVPPSQVRPDLELPAALDDVVMRALAKKREQRLQSMNELIAALEGLQTPVGLSVTGSPVYALTPLPPGASADAIAAPGLASARATQIAPSEQPTQPDAPAARRIKDEPEFVTADKPITFEHVFTEPGLAAPRRLWPYVLLFVLVAAAAAATVVVVIRNRSAAPAPVDAGLVVHAPDASAVDAMALVPVTTDAGSDALDIVVLVDAAPRVSRTRDAGTIAVVTPNGRGTISIQVITKPEGATLYSGTSYRGPGGTNIEQPFGTKLEITCKHAGYKPGKVQLVFDGKQEVALCALERIKICIDGVKNPFDDCEPDPTRAGSSSPIDNPLP